MNKNVFPVLSVGIIVLILILVISTFSTSKNSQQPSAVIESSSTPDISPQPSPVIESSSLIHGWGKNDDGQYGPARADGGTLPGNVTEVAAGKSHTLALRDDGTVWSWGSNESGQLGRITKNSFDAVPAIIPNLTDVVHISAKADYSLALKRDGTVWSWGNNFTGALGTGDNEDRSIPTPVVGANNITAISAGNKFALALHADGTVWGWGGSCNDSNRSRAVDLLNKVGSSLTQIDGGYYDANSTGEGTYNQGEDCLNEHVVGIKSTIARKLSDDLSNAVQVSAGYGHGLILKKDGSVWAFGCNLYGQLGAKHFENQTSNSAPRKIATLPDAAAVSAGFRHSLALTKEGKVYAWGINSKIDPNGNTFNSDIPLLIHMPEKMAAIKDGHDYSLAVGESGALWGWGMDNFNFFENGRPKFHAAPYKLMSGPTYINTIGTGAAHILAITKK